MGNSSHPGNEGSRKKNIKQKLYNIDHLSPFVKNKTKKMSKVPNDQTQQSKPHPSPCVRSINLGRFSRLWILGLSEQARGAVFAFFWARTSLSFYRRLCGGRFPGEQRSKPHMKKSYEVVYYRLPAKAKPPRAKALRKIPRKVCF